MTIPGNFIKFKANEKECSFTKPLKTNRKECVMFTQDQDELITFFINFFKDRNMTIFEIKDIMDEVCQKINKDKK